MVRNAVRMLSYSLYSSLGRRNGGGRKCVTNGKESNSLVAKCHELPHEHRRDPRVCCLADVDLISMIRLYGVRYGNRIKIGMSAMRV